MLRWRAPLTMVTLSTYQAGCLVQSGYPQAFVKVIPPGTDLPPAPLPSAPLEFPIVLFTGRILFYKGLDRLLRAMTMVPSPARLVVEGDGPALGAAQALARTLGIQGRVEFVGWAPHGQHVANYQRAAVVVVPSVWPEPFGMVGIEAMSYGKPVVASRVGGIPEWLEDGRTGFLVDPDQPQQLAEKIVELLTHPQVAREMGLAGRRRVETTFTRTAHLTRLLDVYREALEEHRVMNVRRPT